nr:hypothetical protein CFP56_02901 [Quercus suber]
MPCHRLQAYASSLAPSHIPPTPRDSSSLLLRVWPGSIAASPDCGRASVCRDALSQTPSPLAPSPVGPISLPLRTSAGTEVTSSDCGRSGAFRDAHCRAPSLSPAAPVDASLLPPHRHSTNARWLGLSVAIRKSCIYHKLCSAFGRVRPTSLTRSATDSTLSLNRAALLALIHSTQMAGVYSRGR